MAAHNYDWARTGHIPAFKSVLEDPRFKALPHRADIAPLAAIGRPLPSNVQRQNAIEGIVGEEASGRVHRAKERSSARSPTPSVGSNEMLGAGRDERCLISISVAPIAA